MEKVKEKLKKKVKDEMATYAILIAICITFITTIGIYTFLQYKESVTTGNISINNKNQIETESIENLTSVENINSVEELQKLNEKELEEAKKKEDKDKNKVTSTPQYYIKVNYGAQVVTVYTKDSEGKYTKPVKAMVCSTGTYTPTSGVYKIPNKFRWLDMIGDVYAQYCTQIVGDILFHSVPYLEKYDNSSLEYWAYDKLGTRASLGCVRLTCKDAKWIYDNCKLGTQVEFYSSSNPGPLGKPSARKISNAPSYVRGWDPTDPASNNPWKKYLEELKEKENNKEENKNNEIKQPENTSKPSNEEVIKNEVVNETANEVVNEIVNEEVNEMINDTINETVNSTEEPDVDNTDINTVNSEITANSTSELTK